MEAASAAAVASAPSIKGSVHMDSFDAKIVQYQCAISKLQLLTTHVKATNIKVRADDNVIPLIHHIVTLAGPWVGVHDTLRRRLEQVSRLEALTDTRKVNPPVATVAVSFDVDESHDTSLPDYTRTDVNYSTLLENLLLIFDNAILIYKARLQQCLVERDANRRPDANHKPIPLDMDTFLDILEPLEVLCLSRLVTTRAELTSCQFKVAPIILESVSKVIQSIQKYSTELVGYKKKTSEAILKRLPGWTHTTHRIFACFVKLGEMYNILRKLGRDLYLPVSEDLHSPKLLYNNVKLEVSLNSCDEFFKSQRKNEQILFMLARAMRQGSFFYVRRDTILSLIMPLEQSVALTKNMVDVLSEFLKNWQVVDAKEKREKLKLDIERAREKPQDRLIISPSGTKRLSVLFNPEKEKLSQEAIAKQQRDRERSVLEERAIRERAEKERQTIEDIKSKRRIEERERKLRDELKKDGSPNVSRNGSLLRTRQRSGSNASTSSIPKTAPVAGTRQRSGSNASTTSNSSSSSVLNSMRNNSLTSPPQRSPTAMSRSPSLQVRRPASVYMSSPAFDIRSEMRRQEKAKAAAAAAGLSTTASQNGGGVALRRTPSLPIGRASPTSKATNAAQVAAAAGAASALKQERSSSLQNMERYRQLSPQTVVNERPKSIIVQKRSPSPLRVGSGPAPEHGLPDINELSIQPDVHMTPPRPTVSKLSNPEVTTSQLPEFDISKTALDLPPRLIIQEEEFTVHDTPSKSPAPGTFIPQTQPSPSRTLDPLAPPELSVTTETSTESSVSTAGSDDGKTLSTVQELPETPKKIVKKVRFTGVPDEIEEDSKPKRRGWIHPPKLLVKNKQNTSLSYAAQALVQQERMTFSSIKRGQLDEKTGKIVYPEKNTRIMSSIGSGQNNASKGKWRIGGRLKDRFA